MKKSLCILLFFPVFAFASTCFQIQKSDTLIINLYPSEVKEHYKQIQEALNIQTPKHFLKINLSGEFILNQTIATNRDNTVINFFKNSKILLTDEKNGGIAILHNNCEILNGIIVGNNKSTPNFYQGYGIALQGVRNCKIKNTTFQYISGHSIFFIPREKTGCLNNLIENNTIQNPCMNIDIKGDDSAILLGYSGNDYFHSNNTIRGNYIDGNNILKIGIGIIGHGRQNTIEDNVIQNVRNYGIVAYESVYTDKCLSEILIKNNTVKNVGEINPNKTVKGMGIYILKCSNSIVSNNKVFNTLINSDETETLSQGAIGISMSPNCLITDNVIEKSYMYGIFCDYSFNSKIINNQISNIRKSGIYLVNVNDVGISNNTFKDIQEVVFKGYFENTSLEYIKEQWQIDTYLNMTTGKNINIDGNKIYSDNQILRFTGTTKETRKFENKIMNNTFINNLIFSNSMNHIRPIEFVVEIKDSNTVSNNKILKNYEQNENNQR